MHVPDALLALAPVLCSARTAPDTAAGSIPPWPPDPPDPPDERQPARQRADVLDLLFLCCCSFCVVLFSLLFNSFFSKNLLKQISSKFSVVLTFFGGLYFVKFFLFVWFFKKSCGGIISCSCDALQVVLLTLASAVQVDFLGFCNSFVSISQFFENLGGIWKAVTDVTSEGSISTHILKKLLSDALRNRTITTCTRCIKCVCLFFFFLSLFVCLSFFVLLSFVCFYNFHNILITFWVSLIAPEGCPSRLSGGSEVSSEGTLSTIGGRTVSPDGMDRNFGTSGSQGVVCLLGHAVAAAAASGLPPRRAVR